MDYDLELNKAISKIKTLNAKLVCIQLPDGLKRYADQIQEVIEKNTEAIVLIYFASCFGACDIPEIKEADLLIQWGHSEWNY